jgi:hypothetical protein
LEQSSEHLHAREIEVEFHEAAGETIRVNRAKIAESFEKELAVVQLFWEFHQALKKSREDVAAVSPDMEDDFV